MTLRRGQIVAVEFLDHVANASRPLKFVVYGRLAGITRTALSVDSWTYADRRLPADSNVERRTIVRAAITKIWILRKAKEGTHDHSQSRRHF